MKILGIVGSKRSNGNTASLIKRSLKVFEDSEGFSVEILYLGEMDFDGCNGCEGCARTNRCVLKDDMQNAYRLMREADAFIIGSPTYFYNVSSDMKKFIDRCYAFTSYMKSDRSVWTSEFDSGKRRFAGYISICEQNNTEDMGFTPVILQKSFECLGFRTIFNQKVLHCFKPGEVNSKSDALKTAEANAVSLKETMLLQQKDI